MAEELYQKQTRHMMAMLRQANAQIVALGKTQKIVIPPQQISKIQQEDFYQQKIHVQDINRKKINAIESPGPFKILVDQNKFETLQGQSIFPPNKVTVNLMQQQSFNPFANSFDPIKPQLDARIQKSAMEEQFQHDDIMKQSDHQIDEEYQHKMEEEYPGMDEQYLQNEEQYQRWNKMQQKIMLEQIQSLQQQSKMALEQANREVEEKQIQSKLREQQYEQIKQQMRLQRQKQDQIHKKALEELKPVEKPNKNQKKNKQQKQLNEKRSQEHRNFRDRNEQIKQKYQQDLKNRQDEIQKQRIEIEKIKKQNEMEKMHHFENMKEYEKQKVIQQHERKIQKQVFQKIKINVADTMNAWKKNQLQLVRQITNRIQLFKQKIKNIKNQSLIQTTNIRHSQNKQSDLQAIHRARKFMEDRRNIDEGIVDQAVHIADLIRGLMLKQNREKKAGQLANVLQKIKQNQKVLEQQVTKFSKFLEMDNGRRHERYISTNAKVSWNNVKKQMLVFQQMAQNEEKKIYNPKQLEEMRRQTEKYWFFDQKYAFEQPKKSDQKIMEIKDIIMKQIKQEMFLNEDKLKSFDRILVTKQISSSQYLKKLNFSLEQKKKRNQAQVKAMREEQLIQMRKAQLSQRQADRQYNLNIIKQIQLQKQRLKEQKRLIQIQTQNIKIMKEQQQKKRKIQQGIREKLQKTRQQQRIKAESDYLLKIKQKKEAQNRRRGFLDIERKQRSRSIQRVRSATVEKLQNPYVQKQESQIDSDQAQFKSINGSIDDFDRVSVMTKKITNDKKRIEKQESVYQSMGSKKSVYQSMVSKEQGSIREAGSFWNTNNSKQSNSHATSFWQIFTRNKKKINQNQKNQNQKNQNPNMRELGIQQMNMDQKLQNIINPYSLYPQRPIISEPVKPPIEQKRNWIGRGFQRVQGFFKRQVSPTKSQFGLQISYQKKNLPKKKMNSAPDDPGDGDGDDGDDDKHNKNEQKSEKNQKNDKKDKQKGEYQMMKQEYDRLKAQDEIKQQMLVKKQKQSRVYQDEEQIEYLEILKNKKKTVKINSSGLKIQQKDVKLEELMIQNQGNQGNQGNPGDQANQANQGNQGNQNQANQANQGNQNQANQGNQNQANQANQGNQQNQGNQRNQGNRGNQNQANQNRGNDNNNNNNNNMAQQAAQAVNKKFEKGDFATFAAGRQAQQVQQTNFIRSTFKQAVEDYFWNKKQYFDKYIDTKKKEKVKMQTQLQKIGIAQMQMIEFLQQPVQYFVIYVLPTIATTKQRVEKFLQLLALGQQFFMVDGNLQLAQNVAESTLHYAEENCVIPMKNGSFIQIKNGQGKRMFYIDGEMVKASGIEKINNHCKEKIRQYVIQFLKQRKIAVKQTLIGELQLMIDNKMKMIAPP